MGSGSYSVASPSGGAFGWLCSFWCVCPFCFPSLPLLFPRFPLELRLEVPCIFTCSPAWSGVVPSHCPRFDGAPFGRQRIQPPCPFLPLAAPPGPGCKKSRKKEENKKKKWSLRYDTLFLCSLSAPLGQGDFFSFSTGGIFGRGQVCTCLRLSGLDGPGLDGPWLLPSPFSLARVYGEYLYLHGVVSVHLDLRSFPFNLAVAPSESFSDSFLHCSFCFCERALLRCGAEEEGGR